ncbi:RagB/SusD family nutrient uptake outer membrane protein [Chryseobacterium carnipullorum]|uniref:RagB/SusD family nutrient uptake outer membrane protein n=1 Tax=Chryseobacterium carnipullorum TaxID=1124835 RepID=UPI001E43068A|nr:RagB/SusD family nutrient uptake outer membrane protein [Chryseobacterium carnipullorum]
MKTKIKYIIAAGFAASSLLMNFSCEKFIETDFPSNQISSQLVFEDEQTAEAALAGLYSGMWTNSMFSGGIDGMGALLGTYTDDLTCVYTSSSNGALDLFNNQQIPTNTAVTSLWTYAYQQIYIANSIIEGVNNSKSLSVAAKDRIRGEALFVRSLIYLNLYGIFDEIPYADTTDYLVNSQLSRMPKDALLLRIETDLSEAVNLLPASYRNVERIYPNKFAGYMALAKMKMLLKNGMRLKFSAGRSYRVLNTRIKMISQRFSRKMVPIFFGSLSLKITMTPQRKHRYIILPELPHLSH